MGLLDSVTDRLVSYGQGVVQRILTPAVDARAQALAAREALYQGRQYEGRGLAPSWDKTPPGRKPAPLRSQKPSVQYDLPKTIVDRPTALLFGEGRAPTFTLDPDEPTADATETNAWLARVADEGALEHALLVWSRLANQAGSGCLTWAVVAGDDDDAGEFEFTPHRTAALTPTFDAKRPDRLVALEKKYAYLKTVRQDTPAGVVQVQETWWHRETWDKTEHVVYADQKATAGGGEPESWPDPGADGRAVHAFGFCPAVWVKPIDDAEPANVDGPALTSGVEDLVEDVDRTLSQKSRALRYNLDPERYYKGLTADQAAGLATGGGATTSLPINGDAGLIEMSSDPPRAAEEHVSAHKNRVLETARVVSPDPDKLLAAARSGIALRILHGAMIELCGELRQTFGRALRQLLNQVLRAARAGALGRLGRLASPPPAAIPAGRVQLTWGSYFELTPEDLTALAGVAATLVREGLCDRETAVRWLATLFGWRDVDAILERLEDEDEAAQAQAAAIRGAAQPTPPPNVEPTEPPDTDDPAGAREPAADQET